jgi:hypothetical protein
LLRTLLIASLTYCITLTAFAQQPGTAPAPQGLVSQDTTSIWPHERWSLPNPNEVIVVTLARPGIRQRCRVPELTLDTLTCESPHHRASTIYQREDIAALIAPPSHQERNIMLIPVALMAVSLVGSFFVPLAWSITLRVFSGVCLSVFGAMGIGATGSDHNEILLYQRPNTPLTVKLHA